MTADTPANANPNPNPNSEVASNVQMADENNKGLEGGEEQGPNNSLAFGCVDIDNLNWVWWSPPVFGRALGS